MGEDVIGGRVSLVAEDGERRNFHRSVRALPAARGHAGRITCHYDTAGHNLSSRLCRVRENLPSLPECFVAKLVEVSQDVAGDVILAVLGPPSWDLTHHRYRGTEVTVGVMAGVACAEWHLHAWDLARALGKDYRPADPELVLTAWRAGMPQLGSLPATGWRGDDPWHFLLGVSGRDPAWTAALKPSRRRSKVFGS